MTKRFSDLQDFLRYRREHKIRVSKCIDGGWYYEMTNKKNMYIIDKTF
jgi:hypothetical protein